jgi:DNA-binding transcriptional regulator YdaS (Cro superfamily)
LDDKVMASNKFNLMNATPHPDRDEGLTLAIKAAGGPRRLARALGLTRQAIYLWKRIPADRILQVEAVTKIPREKLRPELYRIRSRPVRRVP